MTPNQQSTLWVLIWLMIAALALAGFAIITEPSDSLPSVAEELPLVEVIRVWEGDPENRHFLFQHPNTLIEYEDGHREIWAGIWGREGDLFNADHAPEIYGAGYSQ